MKLVSQPIFVFSFQNSKLEPRVVNPLGKLIEAFQGPTRLIQKRHDKQLDLQASQQRAEKNRDPNKTRAVSKTDIGMSD
jgi:hypothetical protein